LAGARRERSVRRHRQGCRPAVLKLAGASFAGVHFEVDRRGQSFAVARQRSSKLPRVAASPRGAGNDGTSGLSPGPEGRAGEIRTARMRAVSGSPAPALAGRRLRACRRECPRPGSGGRVSTAARPWPGPRSRPGSRRSSWQSESPGSRRQPVRCGCWWLMPPAQTTQRLHRAAPTRAKRPAALGPEPDLSLIHI